MYRPRAYDPQIGYRYQILLRNPAKSPVWEHCDYAEDEHERNHLLATYRDVYPAGWEYKVLVLPRKYWPRSGPRFQKTSHPRKLP